MDSDPVFGSDLGMETRNPGDADGSPSKDSWPTCREAFVEECGDIWNPAWAQEEDRYELGQGLPPCRPRAALPPS